MSDIQIRGEPTTDPQVCRFIVDRPVYEGGSFNARSKDMATGSPLLEAIFAIEGIAQVHVTGSTVTVAKAGDAPWPMIGKQVGAAIRAAIAQSASSGAPMISAEAAKKVSGGMSLESPEAKAVLEVLEEEINPAVSSHGGHVTLVGVRDGVAYVQMGGGCQGCSSADATLKGGIEVAIKERVPGITAVRDVTEHEAGENPYF